MTSREGAHPRVVILTQSKVNAKSIQYYSQSDDRAGAAAAVRRQPGKKHKNVHSSIIKACALMPDKLQLSFGCSSPPPALVLALGVKMSYASPALRRY